MAQPPFAPVVGVPRWGALVLISTGVGMLILGAGLIYLALSDPALPAWRRLLTGAAGLYLIVIFESYRRGQRTPPRIDAGGVRLYRRGDLDLLTRTQQVPWSAVTALSMHRNGLVWIEHTAGPGDQARTCRDPLATQTYRNGPELRQALRDAATRYGVALNDPPEMRTAGR